MKINLSKTSRSKINQISMNYSNIRNMVERISLWDIINSVVIVVVGCIYT
jgi:hypothetical protein